jgi:DNA-binding transcriptional regulator WhiA
MFSICKNFIKVNQDLFQVLRQYAEDRVNNPEVNVENIKQWLGADTTFKKDGMLYFCIKIEESEIIN